MGVWEMSSHLPIRPPRRGDRLEYLPASEVGAGGFPTDVVPEVAAERLRIVQ